MNRQDVLKKIADLKIEFVYLLFTDIIGNTKKVTIQSRSLESALDDGVWFDGSSIEGFARICESDMLLKPDVATFSVLPWCSDGHHAAQIICDVYMTNGEPFAGDPRGVLKRVMAKAAAMGTAANQ